MNDSCRYNTAIECNPSPGLCSFCSWYPQEQKRRSQYVLSRAQAIESRRKGKNGVMLKIRRKGNKSTYCLKSAQTVKKASFSRKYYKPSKTQHSVEKSTG